MAFRISAARVAVAVSLATLLHIPIAAVARSGGLGFGARQHSHRAFNAVPYGGFVGGMVSSAYYGPEGNIPPLQGWEFPPDPPRVLTCHRSKETIAVPVEGGGEQQVTITRC
jgi:hypothetical protein